MNSPTLLALFPSVQIPRPWRIREICAICLRRALFEPEPLGWVARDRRPQFV